MYVRVRDIFHTFVEIRGLYRCITVHIVYLSRGRRTKAPTARHGAKTLDGKTTVLFV